MNKLYYDRNWLETKYNKEKLSTPQIAKLCNVSQSTIRNRMREVKLNLRSKEESTSIKTLRFANHCTLSQEAIEWINGELLGDGSIVSYSNYSALFGYGSKYLEYIRYVKNKLKSFEIKQSGKIHKQYYKKLNRSCYFYASLRYEELLSFRKNWYPNGKKIVPRDIKLTPTTVRQWYIGDGGLDRSTMSPYIKLYTYGFSIDDVEFLKEGLIKLGFKVTRHSTNILYISTKSVQDFLNYIGPCPVQCYQYKWNLLKKEVL